MSRQVTYVSLDPRARMHAAFFVATLLTCGLGAIPWIMWAIATRKKN